MRKTSEGQSKALLNSRTPRPKPFSESRTHVTWPNREPVVASQVLPPSRVWRKTETCGISRRLEDGRGGFTHSGIPEREDSGGFQPVMMPTSGPAKSIQL